MAVAVASTSVASSTTTTSTTIPVPTGVSNGDIVLAVLPIGGSATCTPPSGFQVAPQTPQTVTGYLHIFWKRATGAESGNYVFTHESISNRGGGTIRFTGCPRSGDPFAATTVGTTSSTTSTAALSLTDLPSDTILVWAVSKLASATLTAYPSGFTTLVTTAPGGVGYKTLSAATSSGTVQGTVTASNTASWMAAIRPEAGFGAFF